MWKQCENCAVMDGRVNKSEARSDVIEEKNQGCQSFVAESLYFYMEHVGMTANGSGHPVFGCLGTDAIISGSVIKFLRIILIIIYVFHAYHSRV